MTTNFTLEELADIPKLQTWLDDNIPSLGSNPLHVEFIHGGTSNVILSLNRGGKTVVLRRTPPNPPKGSIKAIEREATLLSALGGTAVPHPTVHGSCTDHNVIGGSFYVMDLVDGWAPDLNDRACSFIPPFDAPEHKAPLAYAMMDGLIELAKVDYKAVGLEGFGKPDGFLKRQVDRWGSQLEGYKTTYKNYQGRDIPGLEFIANWLRENTPAENHTGIIHGDYGFPNVMYQHQPPAKLAAMIDWELATIGDPMMDIGWYLGAFRDEREPNTAPATSYFDPTGFPTRQELAQYYAQGTGMDVSNLDYYLVLALYKSTCILEYKVAAAMDGLLSEDALVMFTKFVLDSASEAEKIARWNS